MIKLGLLSVIVLASSLCGATVRQNYNTRETSVPEASKVMLETINLKENVMFRYYEMAVNNETYSSDFESFCDNYENSGMKILDFVSGSANPQSVSSSSGGQDFRLGMQQETVTSGSRFRNGYPFYNAYEFNEIQVGDIILEDELESFWHTAVVVDTYRIGCIGTTNFRYIETVEALNYSVAGAGDAGVQYGYLDDQRIIDKNVKVLRVNESVGLTDRQRQDIVYFLNSHIGDAYLIKLTVNTSNFSNVWYCNELVYAAYIFAGIDLLPEENLNCTLIGTEFLNSGMTYEVDIAYDVYLNFGIAGYSSNKWKINIFNRDRFQHQVYYNEKMCFEDDAKNWTGLNDIVPTPLLIGVHAYETVYISTNWFATSITASFTYSFLGRTERMVTYAKDLNRITKSRTQGYNCIYE